MVDKYTVAGLVAELGIDNEELHLALLHAMLCVEAPGMEELNLAVAIVLEAGKMDTLTAKMIESRQKSINKLDAEIAEFQRMEEATPLPVLKLTYGNQRKLRVARRAKLDEELQALLEVARASAASHPSLPGVGPVDAPPAPPKKR